MLDGDQDSDDGRAGETAATEEVVEAKQDRDLMLTAFQSLPERWRLVLWHTAVEGRKPAEVADVLELTPNGVAALAYRARDGLREAYLQAHLVHRAPSECHDTVIRLGAYVRGGLPRRDRRPVAAHLATCEPCRALLSELRHVNASLRNVFVPLASVPAGLGLVGRVAATLTQAGARFGGLGVGLPTRSQSSQWPPRPPSVARSGWRWPPRASRPTTPW